MSGFSSYRDPNTTATIDTFQRAVEWAATSGNLTPELLEEALLKVRWWCRRMLKALGFTS